MRIISRIVSTLVSYQTLLITNITNRAALIFTDSNILLTFDKKQKPLVRVHYISVLVMGLELSPKTYDQSFIFMQFLKN